MTQSLKLTLVLLAGGFTLAAQPAAPLKNVFDVRQYGASGKREENATKAIRAAVEACFTAGGGVVYVPPGEYTTGTIELRDNVNLHLEAGATLFLSQDRADFGGRRAMIYSEGAKNIAVTGRGTLDGLAQYEWAAVRGADPEIAEQTEIARQAGIEMKRFYRTGMQTYMFILNDSVDVRLEGITILHSPLWNVRLNDCDRVFIRGVHIYSDLEKGVNADGIDIVSSSNVLISDSIIVTADDAIAVKTVSRGADRPARPVENVVVTNCVLSSSSSAFTIGTETLADVRHVVLSNSVIRNSNKGVGINVQDGATVSDVRFSNLTMELNRRHWNWWGSAEAFGFVLKKRRPNSRLGMIRDVVVDNVIAHARGTSRIIGHAERGLENITISNLQLFMVPEDAKDKRATDAVRIERVDGLQLRNVTVKWATEGAEPKWRSAITLTNVKDLEITGLRARQGIAGGTAPSVVLENTEGAVIRDSRADAGTGAFLSVRGAGTKGIRLRNNDLETARTPIEFENDALKQAVALQ